MVQIRTEFGSAGYAAVCLILEKITGAWEEDTHTPELTLPLTDWQALTELSSKKLRKFFENCRDPSFMEVSIEGKKAHVSAPILIKLQDEYRTKVSRKSGQTPDTARILSATDKQQETDVCEKQERQTFAAHDTIAVRKVLLKSGIDPDSSRGERCYQLLLSKNLKNPAGYLVGVLKKNPRFGLEGDEPLRQPTDRPLHASHVLRQTMNKIAASAPLDDNG